MDQDLEEVSKTYPADAIYVYGHGNSKFGVTGNRGDLLILRDYFSALVEYVQKELKVGKPKNEIIALMNFPGFPDFHVPPSDSPQGNRLPGNLSVVYDELTEKKA